MFAVSCEILISLLNCLFASNNININNLTLLGGAVCEWEMSYKYLKWSFYFINSIHFLYTHTNRVSRALEDGVNYYENKKKKERTKE